MCCFSRGSRRGARRGPSSPGRRTSAGDRLELDRRDAAVVNRAEEVANVEDPEDLVERSSIHGITRERRVDDRAQRLLGRHVGGDPDDVRARHHHGGDLLRREVEDLVEHLLLGLLELTDVLGRGDRVTNVLARVRDHPGGRRVDAQEPEDGFADTCSSHTIGWATRPRKSSGTARTTASPRLFATPPPWARARRARPRSRSGSRRR